MQGVEDDQATEYVAVERLVFDGLLGDAPTAVL